MGRDSTPLWHRPFIVQGGPHSLGLITYKKGESLELSFERLEGKYQGHGTLRLSMCERRVQEPLFNCGQRLNKSYLA